LTRRHKGRLKVFLGYAAGVGKTYQMLEEAQHLRQGGADIVIGYFEPHGRKDTIALTEGLETVPRRIVEYRGTTFEEMDADAILLRRPAVCAVDEFAHTNVPGSEREKRWQDVHVLLDAGIDVVTTVNVQHLESLNDQVWQMTGVRVRETIPDWVVDEADEVVLVDLTPRALRNRLLRGVVYAPEKARAAMENFFTEPNLNALREMALRHTAHEVEERLEDEAPARPQASGPAAQPQRAERVLICLTGSPSSAMLIRRGKRVADYLKADCLALHVLPRTATPGALARRREAIEQHLSFARYLRIAAHIIESDNVAAAIADFARGQRVTQIFMGRSARPKVWALWKETTVQQVVRLARDKQITIVAQRRRG
jgi:two-component system, OmpR family, sensor histidine kinase KdpD